MSWTLYESLERANVVLLFFPGAFTSVCTGELCQMSREIEPFGALNATVVGISTDTFYSLDAWAKQESITVPLLSDLQRDVTRAYGVEWPDLGGMGPVAGRAAFVVAQDRTIAFAEQTPTLKDLPDFQAVRAVLHALNAKNVSFFR